MKNSLLPFLLLFCVCIFAQNVQKESIKYAKVCQKTGLKKTGYQLVLKEVISDSRCPEGVTCIWAGETSVVVSVYRDSKLVEDQTMVFSIKNEEENKEWFSKYLPEKQKKIKSFSVLPYPKEGVKINPKNYYIKIGYIK
jgi:hypothetical protein